MAGFRTVSKLAQKSVKKATTAALPKTTMAQVAAKLPAAVAQAVTLNAKTCPKGWSRQSISPYHCVPPVSQASSYVPPAQTVVSALTGGAVLPKPCCNGKPAEPAPPRVEMVAAGGGKGIPVQAKAIAAPELELGKPVMEVTTAELVVQPEQKKKFPFWLIGVGVAGYFLLKK